ncbi:MAG: AmmeMemoRadiSam system radical SAM enzyme [Treponema sp.]|nr:AmmeMemoRadiSam system radical SAM enzyme [Treponema sp.]
MTEALFTSKSGDDICCELCPNKCRIKNGSFGLCGVRGNKGGIGIVPLYGFITALAVDPIEKKPLYHFKPGSKILSLGFAGCNLRCPFCQNWHISQNTDIYGKLNGKWIQPGEVISAALEVNSPSIAYTYSEPLIHAEYLINCMTLAKKHGIKNVLVTNGCINETAAAEILKLTDAANVDLKCFSAETYKSLLGYSATSALLETVKNFIKLCYKMKVHLEITTLIVPELNDSAEEINAAADFITSIDKDIPWHLTAYHPAYHWSAPVTNPDFLKSIAKEAGKKLNYVHTGNI